MPCHHDFLKVSHHRSNTKFRSSNSLIYQETIFRPKTALMFLYLAKLTNLAQNNHQKDVFVFVIEECPTIAQCDGGTYLKLANKSEISSEEVTSITKNINCILYSTNWPIFGVKIVLLVLLAQWWDILKSKNAN